MHVSDALIAPPVAAATGLMAISLIAVASRKVKQISRNDIVPLMGVMGAFVFAAQMINFTIPGTGSSGHLIGGILLSAILGPWAAFITLSSILIVQCLIFADGGLLALGCNILNMAATSCLIAYPLIYKPIVGNSLKPGRIIAGSVLASLIALEAGAFLVSLETVLSGVTALPFQTFIQYMCSIHLAIGIVEGLVTSALIIFVAKYKPNILSSSPETTKEHRNLKSFYWIVGAVTLFLAGGFTVLASEYPDGLEWSMEKVAEGVEFAESTPATAVLADYEAGYSGIVGALAVMILLWFVTTLLFKLIKKPVTSDNKVE